MPLLKQILQLLFTRKALNGSIALFQKRSPENIPSGKLYQSINELPLNLFITAVVDENLSVIVVFGYPSQEEIEQAWSEINLQYSDAMGDGEYRMYLKLYKEITILSANHQCVFLLIEMLQYTYDPRLLSELNKIISTAMVLDPERPKEYASTLRRCFNRSKALKIELDLKLIQFESIKQKFTENGKKPTRDYFQSILITLTDHAKVRVDDTISVFEFCERINRFNKHVETIKNQIRK